MITKKSWEEFKDNGLLFVVNQFLHIFGYALVYGYDDYGNLIEVYPARVKFRGFNETITEEGYQKISKYMLDNVKDLEEESRL